MISWTLTASMDDSKMTPETKAKFGEIFATCAAGSDFAAEATDGMTRLLRKHGGEHVVQHLGPVTVKVAAAPG